MSDHSYLPSVGLVVSQRVAIAVLDGGWRAQRIQMTYRFVGSITQSTWVYHSSRHVSLGKPVAMVGSQVARSPKPPEIGASKGIIQIIYHSQNTSRQIFHDVEGALPDGVPIAAFVAAFLAAFALARSDCIFKCRACRRSEFSSCRRALSSVAAVLSAC